MAGRIIVGLHSRKHRVWLSEGARRLARIKGPVYGRLFLWGGSAGEHLPQSHATPERAHRGPTREGVGKGHWESRRPDVRGSRSAHATDSVPDDVCGEQPQVFVCCGVCHGTAHRVQGVAVQRTLPEQR
jgi:hypothetical protein